MMRWLICTSAGNRSWWRRRLPVLPDVPTFQEQGVADIDVNSWWGLVGPAGLPPSIVSRLNAEVAAVLEDPALLQTLEGWGIQASAGTPEAFGSHVRSEASRWKERVSRFGVELE
jgi:tripartite-type tricarboxylate transporter receptor subunit TctC